MSATSSSHITITTLKTPSHLRCHTEETYAPKSLKKQNSFIRNRKLFAIRSNKLRQKTRQNHRRNQKNYYQKQNPSPSFKKEQPRTNVSPPPMLLKQTSKLQLPFVLQQRSPKIFKRMQILEAEYSRNLKVIETRNQSKVCEGLENQLRVVNRLKGSDLYYQMIRQWHPVVQS